MIAFPHPLDCPPDGILAIGGHLHPDILEVSYSFGIFPWFNEGEPVLWWFPNPRMVLKPPDVRISKSMRTYFNGKNFSFTLDQNFKQVIESCKFISRPGQDGTWISDTLVNSFLELHQRGAAHSVEIWKNGVLVGGLYGMSVGKIFFGESMFSREPNASKFALIVLSKILHKKGFVLIDCQQETDHLARMGASPIKASEFYAAIKKNLLHFGKHQHSWSDWAQHL